MDSITMMMFIEMSKQFNDRTVRIINVDDEAITFSNGMKIEFDHYQDCCEWNYADFSQIEESALNTNFSLPLSFEEVEGSGFRFGNPGRMFFIPCYSEQNGYYSSDINIYFNNRMVIECIECEEHFY